MYATAVSVGLPSTVISNLDSAQRRRRDCNGGGDARPLEGLKPKAFLGGGRHWTGLPWRAGTRARAGAYNGRATAPLPVARSVCRPRGSGGGGGNRREDAKEARESGLVGRGPTDRCNKGLEGGREGRTGGLQSADLDLLRQGGCPGAHTHWLRSLH